MKCIVDTCKQPANEETGICKLHSPRKPSLLRLLLQPLLDLLAEAFRK